MASWTALSAVVGEESADLVEFADNRLRFREDRHGEVVARFFVEERNPWRKIRLTYRQPSEDLRRENYIRASLVRIDRTTAISEVAFSVSSENKSPSANIQSVQSPESGINVGTDLGTYFFYIEVVMRRWLITNDTSSDSLTLNASQADAGYQMDDAGQVAETPSVPIPPPSSKEVAGVQALIKLLDSDRIFGVLTASPELIGVELSTSSTGFSA